MPMAFRNTNDEDDQGRFKGPAACADVVGGPKLDKAPTAKTLLVKTG